MEYNELSTEEKLEKENHNLVYDELQLFQEKVLDIFFLHDFDFLFTGGTALSLKYLNNHRKSYDLDFFGNFNEDKEHLFTSFETELINNGISIHTKEPIDVDIKTLRYVVSLNVNGIEVFMKVEFVEDYFYDILFDKKTLKTDALESIYFRKIYTLTDCHKNRVKDLIDLYHLNNIIEISNFFENNFTVLYKILLGNGKSFDTEVICKTLNLWLKHFAYNEHIVDEDLKKYGSLVTVAELDSLFRDFCTNLCYNRKDKITEE